MRPQYRESLEEWAELHAQPIEPLPPLMEQCPKHGPWLYQHPTIDECPACRDHRQDLADRRDAYWDRITSHLDY